MKLTRFIPVVFILLEACVDPLKIPLLPGTQKFVVDGLITNDPGPYEVKLSYTTSLDNALKKAPVATGASVWIYDNLNNSEKLAEVSPGIYQTSKTGLKGQIGREYYVKIKTKFGREYESSRQRLNPAGEITNVSFQFKPKSVRGNLPDEYIDAITIFVDGKGVEGQENLLRWRWSTIYKARTFPEYKMFQDPFAVPFVFTPLPESCSGYVWRGAMCSTNDDQCPGLCYRGFCLEKIAECTCCECWPYNFNKAALISHNRIVDGIEFKHVDLGLTPVGPMQFHDKYYIKIEQLSVSEEVYDFWNLVEKQSGTGNLFQPNSAKVKGNIHSTTDPAEEVLGIFGVSGVAKKEMYIPVDVVPFTLPPIDTITHDCMNSFQTLYAVKPSFW